MSTKLSEYEGKILEVLVGHGAYTTGQIARFIVPLLGSNRRQHSKAIRQLLLGLEKTGLIKRLDDQKPVCWMRVEKGLT